MKLITYISRLGQAAEKDKTINLNIEAITRNAETCEKKIRCKNIDIYKSILFK